MISSDIELQVLHKHTRGAAHALIRSRPQRTVPPAKSEALRSEASENNYPERSMMQPALFRKASTANQTYDTNGLLGLARASMAMRLYLRLMERSQLLCVTAQARIPQASALQCFMAVLLQFDRFSCAATSPAEPAIIPTVTPCIVTLFDMMPRIKPTATLEWL